VALLMKQEHGDRDLTMRIMSAVLLLLVISDAVAYLDPGTGSMLLQVILGGVAAVAVAIKLYWHKLRAAIGMAKMQDSEEDQPEDESA
jgi:hypothetical protein